MNRNNTEQDKMSGNDGKNDNTEEKKGKSGMKTGLEALALIPQLGLTIAIPIVLGAAAGHWLDEKLGTGVIFSLILLFLGIGGGITGAYRQITSIGKWKK